MREMEKKSSAGDSTAGTRSNQNLWKIIIGHSSIRDAKLIYDEISACSQRLKEGLAYYKEPCIASEKKLQGSKVKGSRLKFVLEISKHLHLDQMLSIELFQAFLSDTTHFSFAELSKKLTKEEDQKKLLSEVWKYYISERRHLLWCIKHLLGYWQDCSHPYRETYQRSVEKLLVVDECAYTEGILKQYQKCANSVVPASLQNEEEQEVWLMANLREQCELLEIILLFHKDHEHLPTSLIFVARVFQSFGFGMRVHGGVGMIPPSAKVLVTHISHLCALILVEGFYLEIICNYQENSEEEDRLSEHPMLKSDVKSDCKELDSLILKWGDMQYHSPVILACTVFKFLTQPYADIEQTRLLGNRALQADVFGYLDGVLDSPFFSGDRPVSYVCKSTVHVLLSLCVTTFSETSLGNPLTLISVATKCLSHPQLRLEFWEKGMESGVGILLASALKRFPFALNLVCSLLEPLAMDETSAKNVFQLLCHGVEHYTVDFTHVPASNIETGREVGSWIITQPLQLYPRESHRLGLPEFILPVDTVGVVSIPADDMEPRQIISWEIQYSAWDLLSLITCSIFHSPGIGVDPTPSNLVDNVAAIARLVTQVLKHDWSLESHLRPITSQYFTLLQKFSSLPYPPSIMLAECLKCVSVMAANDTQQVWEMLSRTDFLPHINFAGSSIETISVAPGHYGQLMNTWERPRGVYPFSMAMLDLLLSGFPPQDSPASNDILACVILVMREMFAGSHSWRYRHSSNRDQIGHKLLQLCHKILSQPPAKTSKGYSVAEFVQHFLLHSVGSHSLLSILSLSLDTVNSLYSSRLSVSSPVLQVEALKLAFKVIDLLLLSKTDQTHTPLEQALATQSLKRKTETRSIPCPVHLVAIIASYIHHQHDPHVPAGATRLLRRLSQVAPMSVFACLGAESESIRDAYIHRLKSHVEDTELKVTILELITECVSSQPGMMELFLKIHPAPPGSSDHKAAYILGPESCLHVVLDFITSKKQTPPSLLQSSLFLLRCLWAGRHDAAIVALRAQANFWKNLTRPLFEGIELPFNGSDLNYLIPCHVMYIVALEVYYVLKDKMDSELLQVLKEFSSKKCYIAWMKRLRALPSTADSASFKAQLLMSQAWSTLLCVASSHEKVFHLSDSVLRGSMLQEILDCINSQLNSEFPPSSMRIALATELSVLYMVLLRKWINQTKNFGSVTVQSFIGIMSLTSRLHPSLSLELTVHIYTSLLQLLSALHTSKEYLEPKFLLDLVPFLEETFKNHSLYLRMDTDYRPDVIAIFLLNELVHSLLDIPSGLQVLKQHSILAVLGTLLGEHLHLASDLEFVTAVLAFFNSLASFRSGAEALLMNRIDHHINISLASAPVSNKEWAGIWQQALRLVTSLLYSLSYQFLSHALDFVGVYREKLIMALDIYHVIKDLTCLEETKYMCQFIFQLSLFQHQWRFSMPAVHLELIEKVVFLTGSASAVLSKRATLKQVIKAMNASGSLTPEEGPLGVLKGKRRPSPRVRTLSAGKDDSSLNWLDGKLEQDDSWISASPAFVRLQDGLVSILTSCMATLRHYSPPLRPTIMEGGIELSEYTPLFSLSLAPPTVQTTMLPPSLATLTSCLSTGVDLINKLDPPRTGTPSRSPIKSPPFTRSSANMQKKVEYLFFLEQVVVVLLSQTSCYLVNPAVLPHDKLKLKKELANELGNFSADLLRNFTRRGAPSPGGGTKMTPPSRSHAISLQDSFSSGKGTSLVFSDTSEQAIFKLADSFSKQFFR